MWTLNPEMSHVWEEYLGGKDMKQDIKHTHVTMVTVLHTYIHTVIQVDPV